MFAGGSIYNFIIRKKVRYHPKITRPMALVLIIAPLVFLGMAYYIGGKSWTKYPIAISAGTFLIFGAMSEGISERGIYYRPLGTSGQLILLAKWQDIKNINIDLDENKLESFKYKTETIFTGQYYSSEEIDEIKDYIETEINNNGNK